jgi:hypothetical protein
VVYFCERQGEKMTFDEFLARFRERHPDWFGDAPARTAPAAPPRGSPAAPAVAVPADVDDGWDGVEVEPEEGGEPENWWER